MANLKFGYDVGQIPPERLHDLMTDIEATCDKRMKQSEEEAKASKDNSIQTGLLGGGGAFNPDHTRLRAFANHRELAGEIAARHPDFTEAEVIRQAMKQLDDSAPVWGFGETLYIRSALFDRSYAVQFLQLAIDNSKNAETMAKVAQEAREAARAHDAKALNDFREKALDEKSKRAKEWKARARPLLEYLDETYPTDTHGKQPLSDLAKCEIVQLIGEHFDKDTQLSGSRLIRKIGKVNDNDIEILFAKCAHHPRPARWPTSSNSYRTELIAMRSGVSES